MKTYSQEEIQSLEKIASWILSLGISVVSTNNNLKPDDSEMQITASSLQRVPLLWQVYYKFKKDSWK